MATSRISSRQSIRFNLFGWNILRYCILVALATHFIDGSFTAMAAPRIVIRDCVGDNGVEPSGCSHIYNSPDICITNSSTPPTPGANNVLTSQTPTAGFPAWLHVQIENTGPDDLTDGTLYVYVAAAATGFSWSSDWTSGNPFGQLINSVPVTLSAGQRDIFTIPWPSVADPYNMGGAQPQHFCILARVDSPSDPICSEGTNTQHNTRNCRKIAWKNITNINRTQPTSNLVVRNISPVGKKIRISFKLIEGVMNLNSPAITVDLGGVLFSAWGANSYQGSGVTIVTGSTIQINTSDAWVELDMEPSSQDVLAVTFSNFPPGGGSGYRWDIIQHEEGDDEPVGGEVYDVSLDEMLPKRPAASSNAGIASALQLSIHPNPAAASTTIGYTLPSRARVTLEIYDAAGRAIRTLLQGSEQAAGRHEPIWDGTAGNGAPVPNGTYIYRLITPLGTVEEQIKMVR